MRRLFMIAAVLSLAGCAAASNPGIEIRTVTVTKEVQRPCAATAPTRPAATGSLPAQAADAVLVLGAKILEWAGEGGYADRAEAAIAECTRPD
jgi:hypothetical protein